MSSYFTETDSWLIKPTRTVYDTDDEVIIANRKRRFSLMKQRMEEYRAINGYIQYNLDDVEDGYIPLVHGQIEECDNYTKTGECKFGESCNFHHPVDRSAPMPSTTNQPIQQNVKLTLADSPPREDTIICPSYLKSGTCKYGITCRFDHPPPGEAIVMATVQGTSSSVGGEEDKGTETIQEPESKGTGK